MIFELAVPTRERCSMVDITAQVQAQVAASGVREGVCRVIVPHTTAGVTINEHADPHVAADILDYLDALVPQQGRFRHLEGNSAAHIKASLMGPSVEVFIRDGRLLLGTWQGIFFCEFDGPRRRQAWVQITGA